jgi:hypothetical protein
VVNRGSQCPRFIADSSLSASIKVVYTNGDGEYEDLFNKDLIEPGLASTTTFSHVCRREFERLRADAEERGAAPVAPAMALELCCGKVSYHHARVHHDERHTQRRR